MYNGKIPESNASILTTSLPISRSVSLPLYHLRYHYALERKNTFQAGRGKLQFVFGEPSTCPASACPSRGVFTLYSTTIWSGNFLDLSRSNSYPIRSGRKASLYRLSSIDSKNDSFFHKHICSKNHLAGIKYHLAGIANYEEIKGLDIEEASAEA